MPSLGLGLGFVVSSSWSSPGVLFPWEPSLGLVAGSVGLGSGSLLAWCVASSSLVASMSWSSPSLGTGESGMSSSASEVELSLEGSPAGP